MSSAPHAGTVEIFKARTNTWFAWLCLGVAALGMLVTAITAGPAALGAAPLLLIAFLGWQLFWMPAVVVHDAGVTLEKPVPVRSWCRGRRWCMSTPALPSPWSRPEELRGLGGAGAGHLGRAQCPPGDLRGLPASTYGPGQSVRPGDLKTTDSGQPASCGRAGRNWWKAANCRRRCRHHTGQGDVPLGGGRHRRTVARGQLLGVAAAVARPCGQCRRPASSRPWFRRTR